MKDSSAPIFGPWALARISSTLFFKYSIIGSAAGAAGLGGETALGGAPATAVWPENLVGSIGPMGKMLPLKSTFHSLHLNFCCILFSLKLQLRLELLNFGLQLCLDLGSLDVHVLASLGLIDLDV